MQSFRYNHLNRNNSLCLLNSFYEIYFLYQTLVKLIHILLSWRIIESRCFITTIKSPQNESNAIVTTFLWKPWYYSRDTCLWLCSWVLACWVDCKFLKTVWLHLLSLLCLALFQVQPQILSPMYVILLNYHQ